MIAFVEIILSIVGLLLLIAFGWSIFDHRDLRAKYASDRDEIAQEMAKMRREIDALKQRTGV